MATRTTKPRPVPTRTSERRYARIPSPIGELLVIRTDEGLCGLYVDGLHMCPPIDPAWVEDDAAFDEVRTQLDEYFAGKRDRFDVPLALEGTEFQRTVWRALLDIPLGETESYGELAERIGRPTAPRAVGMANGKNPVSIIVPCHRVIGANGSLTGYGWGTERKAWLLEHEGARPQPAAGAKR